MVDRVLSFFSNDDREDRDAKVATFQVLALLGAALHELRFDSGLGAGALLLCALLSLLRPARRAAIAVALGWLLVAHVPSFPEISNHLYLALIVLTLACGLDVSKQAERDLFLQSCRWLTVVVFLHAGLQKLWYGYYFDGRLLALLAGLDPDARMVFELLLPAEELARLSDYRHAETPGPFLIDSTFFVLLSNLAWISELLVAALLALPRTRSFAVLVGMGTMIGIQLIARELVFGLLMASLLCLFARRDLNRRLLPIYLLVMLVMVGTRLEWLPAIRWN